MVLCQTNNNFFPWLFEVGKYKNFISFALSLDRFFVNEESNPIFGPTKRIVSEKNLKRNFTFLPREKRFLSYLNLGHEIGIAQKPRGDSDFFILPSDLRFEFSHFILPKIFPF